MMRGGKSKTGILEDQIAKLEAENTLLQKRISDLTQQDNQINPYWEDKVWGRVHHVFASMYAACSYLEVKKGFCCSKHYHAHRANLFCVHSGIVCIQEWERYPSKETSWLYKLHILEANQICTIRAGILHRFRVIESGYMTEIYFPDGDSVSLDDIMREDTGGPDDLRDVMKEYPQYF